ncbi:hypothetical protein BKA66DRAFT_427034 [Pyrenochaeta sp. MPI-SDFR-AT-0127]|nr:hypothetical protein BKA66DRAFT_427034 [Pyrenochaeta sp. MPI-SDFR-AT-0127]
MGIYAAEQGKAGKLSRSRTQPQVSSALNRGQPSNRKAGPSGKEWIDGDAFLDACTCTTECKCRKSQRVLYRSRNTRRRSGEFDDNDEEEDVEYGSGEIRYVLKDDLGRNCGDHSECKKSDAGSDKEVQRDKGKREKRNEEKKRKEEFRGLKEELLEALDERFEGMRKDNHQRGIPGNMAAPPFARGDVLPRPFMMDSGMDPQLAQYMGMMGGDPYGAGLTSLGRMPPGMTGQMRPRSMRPPGVPMGHEAAADMNFEDDMSLADMDGLGPMGMRNPYSMPGMLARKPTRPDFMSVRQAKGSGDFGSAGMHLDPGGLYGQAMRSRKGMLGTRLGGMRRTRPGFGVEDFDVGPSRRPGVRRRGHDDGYETAFESRTSTYKLMPRVC